MRDLPPERPTRHGVEPITPSQIRTSRMMQLNYQIGQSVEYVNSLINQLWVEENGSAIVSGSEILRAVNCHNPFIEPVIAVFQSAGWIVTGIKGVYEFRWKN